MSDMTNATFPSAAEQSRLEQDSGFKPLSYHEHGKRILDLVFVVLALPAILLIIVPFAIGIFLQDFRNPFYVQYRVGRHGRSFRFWKLRSMVRDSDRILEEHLLDNPHAKLEWDKYQKLHNDPRITKLGMFIRKTSIDELPQIWNVLKGDMSLVGPRPMMTEQRDLYPCHMYYKMRPGLTGFWQISSRSRSSFADRARFDRLYYRRLGLWSDLAVMLRTMQVVVRGTGV